MTASRPRLLAISAGCGAEACLALGDRLTAIGVHWLLVREPQMTDRELLSLGRRLRERQPHLRLSLARRADLAVLVGFDGVHLPAAGVPVEVAREVLDRGGDGSIVGRSTHSLSAVERAVREGADYVVFGPVYPPLSKRSARPVAGVEALARAAAMPIAVYALGGVTIDRLAEVAAAGATGAAGISMFDNYSTSPGPLPSALSDRDVSALFSR